MDYGKTPPRPKVTKDMIVEAATKILNANRINECADDVGSEYRHGIDPYELAKKLENSCGWSVDSWVVEALGSLHFEIDSLHKSACENWVSQYNIRPSLENGTEIQQGVIDGVYQYSPAYYRVKEHGCTKDGRFLLVKFEDAVVKPINPEITEAH